jgi:hypothetical protein
LLLSDEMPRSLVALFNLLISVIACQADCWVIYCLGSLVSVDVVSCCPGDTSVLHPEFSGSNPAPVKLCFINSH